jgi:hypothetical protein
MSVKAKIRIHIILLFSLLFSASVSASQPLATVKAGPDQTLDTVTAPNQPPVASFTFSVSDLTPNFDGSGSTDTER